MTCSTQQPGMGKKSVMVHAMGSHAGLTNYQSTPVTIHAKCEGATKVDLGMVAPSSTGSKQGSSAPHDPHNTSESASEPLFHAYLH